MKNILERKCSRKGCNDIGHNKAGTATWYCNKHYRFAKMRESAKLNDKVVPSYEQCEEMLQPCLDEHGNLGKCPCCNQQMRWKAGGDKKTGRTISLQHNHDGSMCFICHSCNTGHGSSKLGDKYLEIPVGSKYCSDCDTIKPDTAFYKSKATWSGTQSICIPCHRKREHETRAKINNDPVKRAEHLAKRRQQYAATKNNSAKYKSLLEKARQRSLRRRAFINEDPVKREAYLEKARQRYAAKKQEVPA